MDLVTHTLFARSVKMKNLVLLALFAFFSVVNSLKAAESIAFYYDTIDSVRELINYDRVVVEPSYISKSQISTLHKAGTKVFAYLSVGEYSGDNFPVELLPFKRTENINWKSSVMDLTAEQWQSYLFKQAEGFSDRDFDGLFLDTLDSYQLFAQDETSAQQQEKALSKIIDKLDAIFTIATPSKTRLILNRGFEIMDSINSSNYIVVAESLYHQYLPIEKSYTDVTEEDRKWLVAKLLKIRKRGVEVVIIDYLKPSNRTKQREAAQKLFEDGYTPYVSDGVLRTFGVSTIEPIAKRVLGFYDGKVVDITHSECHRLLGMPLEYLGFIPECKNVNETDFSNIDLSRYAAMYFWLGSAVYERNDKLLRFINRSINVRPILFVEVIPESEEMKKKLGLTNNGALGNGVKISSGKEYLTNGSLELSPFRYYESWSISKDVGEVLVSLSDENNKTSDIYIKTKWGGVIFDPLPIETLSNEQRTDKWLIDPFSIVKTILRLPDIPVADVTTESGRRVMTSHIDGDGFPSRSAFSGRPYAAKIILEKILKKYQVPQTVSIIEGEISRHGLYPKLSETLESIARDMFSLAHVEVASHTFSHPFYWNSGGTARNERYGEHLPIPGYELDLKREITGSMDYINQSLLRKGKKVAVLLWSGNADPTEETVAIVDEAGLYNVNGGNTYTVEGENEFREIWPTIMWYPESVQVYAPILNENVYTNLWTEHFDGYRRVIETFNLLDKPKRIKPISVYYHMYSGVYPVSLESLEIIYDWSAQQKITNLYLSEYAARARSLYETGIAQTLDGDWQITSTGVRSVRLPYSLGEPNNDRSNIYGWQNDHDGRYVSLPLTKSIINFKPNENKRLRFHNANAQILKWKRTSSGISWKFNAHLPLEIELSGSGECKVTTASKLEIETSELENDVRRYKINETGLLAGSIWCPSHLIQVSD